jgi:hypothetical protein
MEIKSKKCSKCGELNNSSNSYCSKCAREYYKLYRLRKKDPNINIEGLQHFIQKIKRQALYVDFYDISNIIFFYTIITYDIHEYDKYKSGKQIKLMWDRIIKFYNNKKYIKK